MELIYVNPEGKWTAKPTKTAAHIRETFLRMAMNVRRQWHNSWEGHGG
jgi:catalase (peroxidase I)